MAESSEQRKRPCGPRKSRKNQDAWSKDELIKLAIERKLLPKYKAQRSSMTMLCFLLGMSNVNPDLPATGQTNKKCGPHRSKTNPSVWSVEELRAEALKRQTELEITPAEIRRMSKGELCNRLFGLQLAVPAPPTEFSGVCKDYTMAQLKELARKAGVATSGTKTVLCDRLREHHLPDPVPAVEGGALAPTEIKIPDDYACLVPPNPDLSLREHQLRVVKHLLKHRGLLAIHPPGSGKTLTAITAMNCVLSHYPSVKCIFISPLSLTENFQKELVKFGLGRDTPAAKRLRLYERLTLYSKEAFFAKYQRDRSAKHCEDTFLILDEAHNYRNPIDLGANKPTGRIAATIARCASKAFKVLLLTATPMKNRESDMINLITMVDGTPFTKAPSVRFFNRVIMGDDEEFERDFKCKFSMLKRVSDDPNYPRRIDEPKVEFQMTPEFYGKYWDVQEANAKKFLIDLYGNPAHFKMFYSALRRAALSLDDERSPKVQWTFNKLKSEAEAGRKSIAYSAWKESGLFKVAKLLDVAKIPYGMIIGDLTASERKRYKDQFNEGKIKILLLSKAGGEGLDLTEVRNVILTESNWSAADDEQIIGRAIRFRSHARLPADQRTVSIWRLFMRKPLRRKIDPKTKKVDPAKSVDEILYDLSYAEKEPRIEAMLQRLEPLSIENVDCQCYLGTGGECKRDPPVPDEIPGGPDEAAPIDEVKVDYDIVPDPEAKVRVFKRLRRAGYVPPRSGTALLPPAKPVRRIKPRPPRKRRVPDSPVEAGVLPSDDEGSVRTLRPGDVN